MAKKVLLCSLDGVRPDAIQAASTPTLDRLVTEGAHTWQARTAMPSSTLVLSDHGGHEKTHRTDSSGDMTIPWILHGAGVRRGHQITGPVRIYDTCVTRARILGLSLSEQRDGRVIEEALQT